jgi:hypothetical protein
MGFPSDRPLGKALAAAEIVLSRQRFENMIARYREICVAALTARKEA